MERLITDLEDKIWYPPVGFIIETKDVVMLDPLAIAEDRDIYSTEEEDYLISRSELKYIVHDKLYSIFCYEILPHFTNFDTYLRVLVDLSSDIDSDEIYWYCRHEFDILQDFYFDYKEEINLYDRFWSHVDVTFMSLYDHYCDTAIAYGITFEDCIDYEEGGNQSAGKEKFLKILDDIKLKYDACNTGNFEVIE